MCLPGQVHVLHPDEVHDGGPGTDAGFAYRILYIEPELVHEALGGGPLPFVADPVHDPAPATADLARILAGLDDPVSGLARSEVAETVARVLLALSRRPATDGPIDLAAVARVRDHLAAHAGEQTPAAQLERIAGVDRYTLARHFRRAYGTDDAPPRPRPRGDPGGRPAGPGRRRRRLRRPEPHDRQFVRAYGLTPGRWARIARLTHPIE